MVEQISYDVVRGEQDLLDIISLQSANLPGNISVDEKDREGFVTVHHTLDQLTLLNRPYPHIIAKLANTLVGYALVMLSEYRNAIPVLVPLFDRLDAVRYHGKVFSQLPYLVMGQICIAKGYRGQGIFSGLYQKMKIVLSPHYEWIVTSISIGNPRSIRAHQKIGFVELDQFVDHTDEWIVVGWNLHG